jgi:hypothetical protein
MKKTRGRGEKAAGRWCAAPPTIVRKRSAFDQAHFTGARSLAGIFLRELHALSFPQQLEHSASDGTAVEEVFDSTFIPDEAEAFVDQKASDRPGWHTRVLR